MGKAGQYLAQADTYPPSFGLFRACFPQCLTPELGKQKAFGSSGGLRHLCLPSS